MSDWRKKLYEDVEHQQYSKKLTSYEKIIDFFNREFQELVIPIEQKYPCVAKAYSGEDSLNLEIGENKLSLDKNGNEILVNIKRYSDKHAESFGVIKIENNLTYYEHYLPASRKGQKNYLEPGLVDYLFKFAFENTRT